MDGGRGAGGGGAWVSAGAYEEKMDCCGVNVLVGAGWRGGGGEFIHFMQFNLFKLI